MNVFLRDASYVGRGDVFHSGAVALQEIEWIAVKIIGHLLEQDFVLGIEAEDE